ncbi:hypothetical protein DL96DRAFT_201547 [Flagelloscypha sp. PMI_526]|nr:hypothetical protein DL96DRAFT_201547 [Flagelloscypha sp. PMI_526]
MSQVALPVDLIQPILAYISPVLHRETWLACCLVNSNFRAEVQPRGFKFIQMTSLRKEISTRFLALLRSSKHICYWVKTIDIGFFHRDRSLVVEAKVLRLLPSLNTLIFSAGFPGRPCPWSHLDYSFRETLYKHVFPRLEQLHLSCWSSFPITALPPAQSLRSLRLRDVHCLIAPLALDNDTRPLPLIELSLDRTGLEQAVDPGNSLSQLTRIHKYSPKIYSIYSLHLYFSPQMGPQDADSCAVLLTSLREHLTKLQWGSIPSEVWPQFKLHSLLRLSQYPVLEHLVLNAPRDKLQAFISWLVAELLENIDRPLPLKSLSFICDSKTYSKIDSPWSALDQLQSLEHFNLLVFTWTILPTISTFQEIVADLPLCHQRKLLWFNIPTRPNDGEHIRAINQLLG